MVKNIFRANEEAKFWFAIIAFVLEPGLRNWKQNPCLEAVNSYLSESKEAKCCLATDTTQESNAKLGLSVWNVTRNKPWGFEAGEIIQAADRTDLQMKGHSFFFFFPFFFFAVMFVVEAKD